MTTSSIPHMITGDLFNSEKPRASKLWNRVQEPCFNRSSRSTYNILMIAPSLFRKLWLSCANLEEARFCSRWESVTICTYYMGRDMEGSTSGAHCPYPGAHITGADFGDSPHTKFAFDMLLDVQDSLRSAAIHAAPGCGTGHLQKVHSWVPQKQVGSAFTDFRFQGS